MGRKKEGRILQQGGPSQMSICAYLDKVEGPQGPKKALEGSRQTSLPKGKCSDVRASLGAQMMPGKVGSPRPSPGTTSRVGRVRRRNIKGQNKGLSPLEKWLLRSGDRGRDQGKDEEVGDNSSGRESLGPQVRELRRRFEEEKVALGPKK